MNCSAGKQSEGCEKCHSCEEVRLLSRDGSGNSCCVGFCVGCRIVAQRKLAGLVVRLLDNSCLHAQDFILQTGEISLTPTSPTSQCIAVTVPSGVGQQEQQILQQTGMKGILPLRRFGCTRLLTLCPEVETC
jgi:hypothetical protein